MKLDDQFEWDIENPKLTSEQFIEIYNSDLGVAGEFKYVFRKHCFVAILICIAEPQFLI